LRLHDIREQSIKTFFQFQSQPQRNSNRRIIQWIIFHRIDLPSMNKSSQRRPSAWKLPDSTGDRVIARRRFE
jgi:hypothetical protein